MRQTQKWILAFVFCIAVSLGSFLLQGCSSSGLKIVNITMEEVIAKMDAKETFALLVEKENCPFCDQLHKYIEATKKDQPDMVVYQLDTTPFDLKRVNKDDNTLVSDVEEGKEFLKRFPYFLYTPSAYILKDGQPILMAAGFNQEKGCMFAWNVDSTIDLNIASPIGVYELFQDGQPK